ncbi:hypothetical protein K435DRAFT_810166 [Dendrothele bispora CBS 962.96]|uniref:Uncharacterized protein n=1 Tax=Dendrothele bispora (strain CBS 962.96) TaxID=1314807 RepID=A0A4S8KVY6_DENBC|nr:hypothetical protein K435DRAFT_810166 [Dendrothele bispora CBS 962.96]
MSLEGVNTEISQGAFDLVIDTASPAAGVDAATINSLPPPSPLPLGEKVNYINTKRSGNRIQESEIKNQKMKLAHPDIVEHSILARSNVPGFFLITEAYDQVHYFMQECHKITTEAWFSVSSLPNVETGTVEGHVHRLYAIRTILRSFDDPSSTLEEIEDLISYVESIIHPLENFLDNPPPPAQ